jgi:hypothetical protein
VLTRTASRSPRDCYVLVVRLGETPDLDIMIA